MRSYSAPVGTLEIPINAGRGPMQSSVASEVLLTGVVIVPVGNSAPSPRRQPHSPPTDVVEPLRRRHTGLVRNRDRLQVWAVAAGSLAALALAVVLINVAEDRADRLERTGARLQAVVVDFDPQFRRERNWVTFAYSYDGEDLEERIPVTGEYREGAHVDVVVDRSDVSRAIILGERPQSTPAYWATLLSIVAGLGGLVVLAAHVLSGRRTPISSQLRSGLPWRPALLVGGVLLVAAVMAQFVFDAGGVAGALLVAAILALVFIVRIGGETSMRREASRQSDPRYHAWGDRRD